MIDTTAGRSRSASSSAARSTRPLPVYRQHDLAPAQVAHRMGRGQDGLVLDGGDDGAHGAAAVARGQRGAEDAEVVGLGAAGGEDDLVGLGADRLGHLAPGLLQAGARRPGRTGGQLEGLPKACAVRYGSMASRTSARTGVVAAWSR